MKGLMMMIVVVSFAGCVRDGCIGIYIGLLGGGEGVWDDRVSLVVVVVIGFPFAPC